MNFNYDGQYERLVSMVVRALISKYEIAGVGFDEKDLLQEGRLALLKAEKTYDKQSKAKFETYASVVIRNHVLDFIRGQKELSALESAGETGKENAKNNEPPADLPTDPALWEILRGVLKNQCNDLERSIFNAYYKGYSYHEICEIFEISKKKVDNTIQKIYRAARAIYAD